MTLSIDKVRAGRSGLLGAAWDSASSWSGLVHEWARLSIDVRGVLNSGGDCTQSGVERRLAFMGWDLDARLKLRSSYSIAAIAETFFGDLGFRPVSTEPDSCLMDSVLIKREGTTTALAALFAWAADRIKDQMIQAGAAALRMDLIVDAPWDVVRVTQSN